MCILFCFVSGQKIRRERANFHFDLRDARLRQERYTSLHPNGPPMRRGQLWIDFMDSLLGAMLDVLVLQQEQMLLSFGHHARVNGKLVIKICHFQFLWHCGGFKFVFVPGLRRDHRGCPAPAFDDTPLHFLTQHQVLFGRGSAVQQVCSHYTTLQDVADRAALNWAQPVEPFRERNQPQAAQQGPAPPQGGAPGAAQVPPAAPVAPADQEEEEPEMDLE